MNKEALGKFVKGFFTGGGTALTAFLTQNGCNVTDLKAFGYSAGLGFLSGAFHMLWNMYVQSKRSL